VTIFDDCRGYPVGPKSNACCKLVDAVEALGINPADAAPDCRDYVHNRLSVNEVPRIYTRARHQAWLFGGGSRRDRPLGDALNDGGDGSGRGVHDGSKTHGTLHT
jgi:hypothetical protein